MSRRIYECVTVIDRKAFQVRIRVVAEHPREAAYKAGEILNLKEVELDVEGQKYKVYRTFITSIETDHLEEKEPT